jgi:hypothetical protein
MRISSSSVHRQKNAYKVFGWKPRMKKPLQRNNIDEIILLKRILKLVIFDVFTAVTMKTAFFDLKINRRMSTGFISLGVQASDRLVSMLE